jgi:hypothetical protein
VTEPTDPIREQAREVAFLRIHAAEMKARLAIRKAEWEDQDQVLIDVERIARLDVAEQEDVLRKMAIEAYRETQNKHLGSGVEIRVGHSLQYSPQEAFAWAKLHVLALSLDKQSFESLAKADPDQFGFVRQGEKLTVALSQDLAAALGEHGDDDDLR